MKQKILNVIKGNRIREMMVEETISKKVGLEHKKHATMSLHISWLKYLAVSSSLKVL